MKYTEITINTEAEKADSLKREIKIFPANENFISL
jgi:hypothetical protein